MKGNSGAILKEAVVKLGVDCQMEAAFCRHLGEEVCPVIYSSWPEGYAMERLTPAPRYPGLLLDIEELLDNSVWNRPSQSFEITGQPNWKEFQKSLGIETPEFINPKEFCLIHGDPTVSNAMIDSNGKLKLIDPRAPNGHIPSYDAVDMGKILQSFYGWEAVAYDEEPTPYELPFFMRNEVLKKQALFWCHYHVARIKQLETSRGLNRPRILSWCDTIRRICGF